MTLTVHTEKHLLSHAKPFCPVVYIEDDEGNGEGNRAPGFDSGPPQCPYVHVSLLGFRLRSLVKKNAGDTAVSKLFLLRVCTATSAATGTEL